MQTDAIEVFATVVGKIPETIIGELTPTIFPSGIGYNALFEKLKGPTEPTALVDPLKLMQAPGQTEPPAPAFTVGRGFTVTVCVIEF